MFCFVFLKRNLQGPVKSALHNNSSLQEPTHFSRKTPEKRTIVGVGGLLLTQQFEIAWHEEQCFPLPALSRAAKHHRMEGAPCPAVSLWSARCRAVLHSRTCYLPSFLLSRQKWQGEEGCLASPRSRLPIWTCQPWWDLQFESHFVKGFYQHLNL